MAVTGQEQPAGMRLYGLWPANSLQASRVGERGDGSPEWAFIGPRAVSNAPLRIQRPTTQKNTTRDSPLSKRPMSRVLPTRRFEVPSVSEGLR